MDKYGEGRINSMGSKDPNPSTINSDNSNKNSSDRNGNGSVVKLDFIQDVQGLQSEVLQGQYSEIKQISFKFSSEELVLCSNSNFLYMKLTKEGCPVVEGSDLEGSK